MQAYRRIVTMLLSLDKSRFQIHCLMIHTSTLRPRKYHHFRPEGSFISVSHCKSEVAKAK